MRKSLSHNFTRLTQFSGRDTRETFLPYFGILAATFCILPPLLIAPLIEAFYFSEEMDLLETYSAIRNVIIGSTLFNFLFMALVAASVVRRLHDIDWRGYWALLPASLQLAGIGWLLLVTVPTYLGGRTDRAITAIGFLLDLLNLGSTALLFLVSLGLLLIALCRRGTVDENRFGEVHIASD